MADSNAIEAVLNLTGQTHLWTQREVINTAKSAPRRFTPRRVNPNGEQPDITKNAQV